MLHGISMLFTKKGFKDKKIFKTNQSDPGNAELYS